MTNNDILRSLRYSLQLTDARVADLCALGGKAITAEEAHAKAKREGEHGEIFCEDEELGAFLDGLIIENRGPRDGAPPPEPELTNNMILKKIRVALTLREGDLLEILAAGGHPMSKGELSALFRNPTHRSFRPCGDQVLRKLLKGLAARLRPGEGG